MRTLRAFFNDALREATQGSRTYHAWMALLTLLINAVGLLGIAVQMAAMEMGDGEAARVLHEAVGRLMRG